jgi:hypothetical protein
VLSAWLASGWSRNGQMALERDSVSSGDCNEIVCDRIVKMQSQQELLISHLVRTKLEREHVNNVGYLSPITPHSASKSGRKSAWDILPLKMQRYVTRLQE